jgi:hypothetical protein
MKLEPLWTTNHGFRDFFVEHSDTAHVTWVGPWNSGRPEPRTKAGDSPNVWGHRVSATWWPPTYEANSGSSMRPTESLKCNTKNKEIIWNHYFFPNFWTKRTLSDFVAALRLCMIAFTWLQASLLGATGASHESNMGWSRIDDEKTFLLQIIFDPYPRCSSHGGSWYPL